MIRLINCIFFIFFLSCDKLNAQVIPDLSINSLVKIRPLQALSIYNAVQVGYEQRLYQQLYLDSEVGYIYRTFGSLDAFNTSERITGVNFATELRYYSTPFEMLEISDGGSYWAFNFNIRSIGFSDTYQSNFVNVRGNRFTYNLVYGIFGFLSEKLILDIAALAGYSDQYFYFNGKINNSYKSHFVNSGFFNVDGKSFPNLNLRVKIAYVIK